jgi:hypothetical protein
MRSLRPETIAGGMRACLLTVALVTGSRVGAAVVHYGRVTVGGVPVPGATVTALQRDVQRVTVTDPQGVYRFADLADGVWTIRVEMLGFTTISRDITIAPDSTPASWELTLRSFDADFDPRR